MSDDEILERLKANNIAAVAITDHHVMDVERIRNLQRLAAEDMTVFPGIELRSELGGSETVHFIGIFPEDCDVEMVWDKLKGKLDLTPQDVEAKGNDYIYVQFGLAAEIIHELGGLVSVHAGKKTNSIENIGNTQKFKMAFKKDLAERHIDILEVKSLSDAESYKNIVFPKIGFPLPAIVASDNHNIKEYTLSTPCWIKADCTFAGLTHVLHEPEDRVFVGDVPPAISRVGKNKTKYLRSITVRKRQGSGLSEKWFGCSIPLNNGLVAIVGNKGSGKSALADIAGLVGSTKNHPWFSFLSAKKFCQPKANKAEHFEAEAVWETGMQRVRRLSDSVDADEFESVNYIPQSYLEGVCNELGGQPGTGFGHALRTVVYSHVDIADRLGFGTLDELLEYRSKEMMQSIERQKSALADRIKCYLHLLEQSSPSHKKSLANQLEAKQSELAAHEAAKPSEVQRPENDDEAQKQIAEVEQELSSTKRVVDDIERFLVDLEAKKRLLAKQMAAAEKLLKRLDNLDATVLAFKAESIPDCGALGVAVEDFLEFRLNRAPVEEKRRKLESELEEVTEEIGSEETEGIAFQKSEAQASIKKLQDSLDAPNRRYQEYLSALAAWQAHHSELVGSELDSGSLKHIEDQLRLLEELPGKIDLAWEQCVESSVKIYAEIESLADAHRVVFNPVQSFIANHPLAKNRFDLSFEAALIATGFVDRFLAYINQGRKGSFCGAEEGRERVETLIASSDFETAEGLRDFFEQVRVSLTTDLRQTMPSAVSVNDQLSKGQAGVDLFSYVLGLEYLKPQVTLRWAGKDIEQLSPGERGTLLLVFYLLIDKSDIPLIIDQPEENLDNQTVVDFLVPSVKEAKDRRQIILVTHNPNLAVVCDADQIICAHLDKSDGNRVTYATGAIENPKINQRIVDILEGTRRAFDNRDGKYHAAKSQARPRHKAFPWRMN